MSVKANLPRIPVEVGGTQVNFCKNPLCGNFGVPASQDPQPRGPGAKSSPYRDTYTVGTQKKGVQRLRCNKCGEKLPMKSNLAIHEETARHLKYLTPKKTQNTCPVSSCKNNLLELEENPSCYHRFGKTKSGSSRYRCKVAEKSFPSPFRPPRKSPISRQTVHGYKNISIFKLLVKRTPLKRICELEEIQFRSLMQHMTFIHRQCLAFAGERENDLRQMDLGERYLAVDRQNYIINWARQKDRRNIVLQGIGSADLETSYVFGMHLDFVPAVDIDALTDEVAMTKEYMLPSPFQRYARLWFKPDFDVAASHPRGVKARTAITVPQRILEVYEETLSREDVEASYVPIKSRKLPSKGAQIHSEYTLYGHFRFLRHMLG